MLVSYFCPGYSISHHLDPNLQLADGSMTSSIQFHGTNSPTCQQSHSSSKVVQARPSQSTSCMPSTGNYKASGTLLSPPRVAGGGGLGWVPSHRVGGTDNEGLWASVAGGNFAATGGINSMKLLSKHLEDEVIWDESWSCRASWKSLIFMCCVMQHLNMFVHTSYTPCVHA